MAEQKIKHYQTGTFVVGNLLALCNRIRQDPWRRYRVGAWSGARRTVQQTCQM